MVTRPSRAGSDARNSGGGIFVNIRLATSNESFLGYLHIYNTSFVQSRQAGSGGGIDPANGRALVPHPALGIQPGMRLAGSNKHSNREHPNDPQGASYYVIVIVLIYGMSIIALIASHIKRKHSKLVEDRQIHKYLKEFQSIREKSRKDAYRNSERAVLAHLQTHAPAYAPKSTYGNLGQALFPALAIATPASFSNDRPTDDEDDVEDDVEDDLETASHTYTVRTDSSDEHFSPASSEPGSPRRASRGRGDDETRDSRYWRRQSSDLGPGYLPPPPVIIDVTYLDDGDQHAENEARYQRAAEVMLANADLCNDETVAQRLYAAESGQGDVDWGERGVMTRSFYNHGALLSPMSDVDGLTPVSDISLSESFSSTVPLLPSVSFSASRHQGYQGRRSPFLARQQSLHANSTANDVGGGGHGLGQGYSVPARRGHTNNYRHNGPTRNIIREESVTVQVTDV